MSEQEHPGGEVINLRDRVTKIASSTAQLVRERVESIRDMVAERPAAATTTKGAPGAPTVVASNTLPSPDEVQNIFSQLGAIMPPYEPETLVMLFEHSGALRPNVDAYVTNIESFGYRFEPTIDLDSAEADAKIGDAMFLDALHRAGGEPTAQAVYPNAEQVAAKRKEIQHAMRLEKARLESFVEGAVPEASFVDLRQRTRTDLEVTGNAYWEVLRNTASEIAQFSYVPAHSVRLLPIQLEPIEVRAHARVSALSTEKTTKLRRFRAYVQIVNNTHVFFKEFGDPRAMHSRTGQLFQSVEALKAADPSAVPATELVHFRIHSPRTPYGVPRWIGTLLSVLGSRASEEVNYLYFDNKAIPPIAVLVSGGKLAESSKQKIETYIRDHIKGRENFHKILILEAVGPNAGGQTPGIADAGRVRIEIERLTETLQQDALFQNYDERNIDKVGGAFRVPRLIRGDVRDFNRATADAALEFTEMQVFQPERNKFDDFMNRQTLPEMGVRFWRFVSNTPVSKDPAMLTDMICKLLQAGGIVPEEARELARDIFNRDFKRIEEDWTKRPLALTTAGYIPTPTVDTAGVAAPATTASSPAEPEARQLATVAASLSSLRDRLRGAAQSAAERTAAESKRAYDEGEVIKIELTREQLSELIEPAAE